MALADLSLPQPQSMIDGETLATQQEVVRHDRLAWVVDEVAIEEQKNKGYPTGRKAAVLPAAERSR